MSIRSFASDSFVFADHKPAPSADPHSPGADMDHGLLLPAVRLDDGLLLPAVQNDDGLLLPAVQDDGLLLPY